MRASPMQASLPRILIYGDSLSAGFGLAEDRGFAAQLEKALARRQIRVEIDNASQSGETTRGGLARLQWTLDRLPKPDLVILELGANDALRVLPPLRARDNLDRMIKEFKSRNITILLAGMLAPPNLGKRYGEAFNHIYSDLAKRHGVLLYPFFLEGVAGRKELNLSDGKHPNARGVEFIVARILPFVIKGLEQSAQTGR